MYIITSLGFQRFLLPFASIENLFNHNYPQELETILKFGKQEEADCRMEMQE